MKTEMISGCKVHCLKTWPDYYKFVRSGQKKFEVRKYDRNFNVGDILELQEWSPETRQYTGNFTRVQVVYFLTGGQFGIETGYCVMGIEILPFDLILNNK